VSAILLSGAGLGIAAAIPVARLMASVLFEAGPGSWATHGATIVLMLVAGLAASARPVWRASHADPWETLRGD
jgi:ABC-type antimicrobial peptide transport system permease subunit